MQWRMWFAVAICNYGRFRIQVLAEHSIYVAGSTNNHQSLVQTTSAYRPCWISTASVLLAHTWPNWGQNGAAWYSSNSNSLSSPLSNQIEFGKLLMISLEGAGLIFGGGLISVAIPRGRVRLQLREIGTFVLKIDQPWHLHQRAIEIWIMN